MRVGVLSTSVTPSRIQHIPVAKRMEVGSMVRVVSQCDVCIFGVVDDLEFCVVLNVAGIGMVDRVVGFDGHTVSWVEGVVCIFLVLDGDM
jgi:hypothetical protein